MFYLTVETDFDSAHHLPEHKGKCKNLHGHTYKVKAEVSSKELTDGMAVDFKILKDALNSVCDPFDHACLNDFFTNPTAEEMARYIYDKLAASLPVKVEKVYVWESPTSCAAYCRDGDDY